MCQRITCRDCGKPSFRGCGRHVEQVLGDVARDDRCQCGATRANAAPDGGSGSLLDWMGDLFKPRKDRQP